MFRILNSFSSCCGVDVTEPWREEWWKAAESEADALAHAKSVSEKSSRRAILTTYLDDCDLDAAKPLRTLVWKFVRAQFAANDPVQVQKFFGVVREAWDCTSSCRGLRLTPRNGSICSDSSPSSSCCTYSRCESHRCVLLFFALKSIYNTLSRCARSRCRIVTNLR